MPHRQRNFAFTDNTLSDLQTIFDKEASVRYIGYGLEGAPTTGKMHWQGWVQFTCQKTETAARKLFPGVSLDFMRMDESVNETYCMKECLNQTPFQVLGTFIKQGQRKDLHEIQIAIEEGKQINEIAAMNMQLYVQYFRGFKDLIRMREQEQSTTFRKVTIILLQGRTGCGKTKLAMKHATYINSGKLDWWDGYNGDRIICLDEYANQIRITDLLRILDGYQLRLPIKGGFTYARWTTVFITTNLHELHTNAPDEHRSALARRITCTQQAFELNETIDQDFIIPE